VKQERALILSRKYEKGAAMHELFVAEVSGPDVSGTVFQYELWLNNAEQKGMRVTSGNSYTVRRAFLTKLLDLQEDGWSKRGSANYGSAHIKFFDPAEL
jgi:hypothetical protein